MTSFFLGKYSILSNLTLIVGLTSVLNMSSTKADSSNKVCVKAESGEIGCGEVIPSPTSSNNNKKTQMTVVDTLANSSITWNLNSCGRDKKVSTTVVCTFSFVPNKSKDYVTVVLRTDGSYNILVDKDGNAYGLTLVDAFNKTFKSGVGEKYNVFGNLSQGATYSVAMQFPNVPISISEMALVQVTTVGFGNTFFVRFKDISITK